MLDRTILRQLVLAKACWLLALTSAAQQATVKLTDTVALNSRNGLTFDLQPANIFRVAGSYRHSEGLTLIYEPLGGGTSNIEREYVLRNFDVHDGAFDARLITRRFGQNARRIVGAEDWAMWPSAEALVRGDQFPKIVTRFYDETGREYAAHEALTYNTDLTSVLGMRGAVSRYGGFGAVAILTSRRRDQQVVQRERGAILHVFVYSNDGTIVAQRTEVLPDLRARYDLRRFVVDESGTAAVLLEREPFRVAQLTFENPPINSWEWLSFSDSKMPFELLPLLPFDRQLRQLFTIDQDPLAAGFAATYSEKLTGPLEGIGLALATNDRSRFVPFSEEALSQLPAKGLDPRVSAVPKLRAEFTVTDVRVSPAGELFLLAENRLSPTGFRDGEILQMRLVSDGRTEGFVVLRLGLNGDSSDDEGHYIRVRQNEWDRVNWGFQGAGLVPDGDGYAVVYNQDIELLEPTARKRIRATAISFAQPVIARFTDDGLVQKPLEFDTPYDFFPLVYPRRGFAVPDGVAMSFRPLERGFAGTLQFGVFGW